MYGVSRDPCTVYVIFLEGFKCFGPIIHHTQFSLILHHYLIWVFFSYIHIFTFRERKERGGESLGVFG